MRTLKDIVGISLTPVVEKPPNWNDIIKVFPFVEHRAGILFCYGDKIYNPSDVEIPTYLAAHECVHALQQQEVPIAYWWKRYLEDPQYRYEQELEAHCVEFQVYSLTNNRAFRKRALVAIADRLAGPLYGNVVKRDVAQGIIKRERNYVVANG